MLALFRHEDQIRRLEEKTPSRLLRVRFQGSIFALVAEDRGDSLKYLSVHALATQGFGQANDAWAQVQTNMAERAQTLQIFGMAPFWFVDCPGWPPSAFLIWAGLRAWARQILESDRPVMAASFSADQLILGFADSAEFHDRLSHAREAPVEAPLFPLPFLINEDALPTAIREIDIAAGDQVTLTPDEKNRTPIRLPLWDV